MSSVSTDQSNLDNNQLFEVNDIVKLQMLATKPNFYVSCLTSKKIYHLILRLCHLVIYTLNLNSGVTFRFTVSENR